MGLKTTDCYMHYLKPADKDIVNFLHAVDIDEE